MDKYYTLKGYKLRNKNKITEAINKELIAEIDLSYGQDYNVTLKPEQIEFIYKTETKICRIIDYYDAL